MDIFNAFIKIPLVAASFVKLNVFASVLNLWMSAARDFLSLLLDIHEMQGMCVDIGIAQFEP